LECKPPVLVTKQAAALARQEWILSDSYCLPFLIVTLFILADAIDSIAFQRRLDTVLLHRSVDALAARPAGNADPSADPAATES
jgi:hypothetical protein